MKKRKKMKPVFAFAVCDAEGIYPWAAPSRDQARADLAGRILPDERVIRVEIHEAPKRRGKRKAKKGAKR